MAISRFNRMHTILVNQRETFTKLKGMCPDNKIPQGLILAGTDAIIDAEAHFRLCEQADPGEAAP